MKRWLTIAAAGLIPVFGGQPAAMAREPVPVKTTVFPTLPTEDESTCHGTSVHFVKSPSEAAQRAKKEGKLVFVLHVSGHFEDPGVT